MHRKLDMTRPRSRSRIALAVASLIACTTLVAGCSDEGPKPEDQREQMVTTTQSVIEQLTEPLGLTGLTVVDDASEPVSCMDGTRYEYAVDAMTDEFSSDDIDETLSAAIARMYGTLRDVAEVAVFTDVDDNWADEDWDGHSRIAYSAEDGAEKGMEASLRP